MSARKPKSPPERPAAEQDELPDLFNAPGASWKGIDGQVVGAFIDAAGALNNAALFGRSPDGGALHIQMYIGSSRPSKYFHGTDEAEAFMREYTAWAIDRLILGS